ncbi:MULTISPECIES: SdpI family protein [Desulfitobacterium]|uniref:Putative integral membrane protein n=1 Tax=Desulfitobacterium dehalogenans (strain ATCC 51507 / DSM 9161 / JW/IU-DC1) TaxID=756499 RepID=I4ADV2_DESDJ|nr:MULTISPECIES: SdpI family protein [Desulfitobacterium]AFM02137.1 putative integral membrane protein [Desulfitobacterium dehalogenans ATCC 51507]
MENTNTNHQGSLSKIISGILVIINIIVGIWAYPQLPEQVPSHWNFAGQVDGYSGPFAGAFLLPLIILGVYIIFWIIPRIDPKRANYLKMGRVFWIVSTTLVVFLSLMYWGTIAVAIGYFETLPRWYFSGIGIIFILLGNYFGKIKFNYTFGIRTPWTLANEEVWAKTHRFAGPIWIVGGILMALTGLLPAAWTVPLFVIVMCLIAVVPMAYSYLVYRKLNF